MRSSRVSLRPSTIQSSVSGTPASTSACRTCQPDAVATASARLPGNIGSRRPACATRWSIPSSASTSDCQSGAAPTRPASRRTRLASAPARASTRRAASASHVAYRDSAGSASPVRMRSSSQRSSSTRPSFMRAMRSSRERSSSPRSGGPSVSVTSSSGSSRSRSGRSIVATEASSPAPRSTTGSARSDRWSRPAIQCTTPVGCAPSATWPRTHSSSRASTCLHGCLRLGHVHRQATSAWSAMVSYGSAPDPRHRPHTARSSAPMPDHRDGVASGSAAATDSRRRRHRHHLLDAPPLTHPRPTYPPPVTRRCERRDGCRSGGGRWTAGRYGRGHG